MRTINDWANLELTTRSPDLDVPHKKGEVEKFLQDQLLIYWSLLEPDSPEHHEFFQFLFLYFRELRVAKTTPEWSAIERYLERPSPSTHAAMVEMFGTERKDTRAYNFGFALLYRPGAEPYAQSAMQRVSEVLSGRLILSSTTPEEDLRRSAEVLDTLNIYFR